MKIAIHNPVMFRGAGMLHGWILEFVKLYKPIFYISDPRLYPRLLYFLYRFKLNPAEYTFVFSKKQLNAAADVLVCFTDGMDIYVCWRI